MKTMKDQLLEKAKKENEMKESSNPTPEVKIEQNQPKAEETPKAVEPAKRAEATKEEKQSPSTEAPKAEEDKTTHVETVTNGISNGIKTTWEFLCEIGSKGWDYTCGFFNSIMSGIKGVGYTIVNKTNELRDNLNRENGSIWLDNLSTSSLKIAGALMGLGLIYLSLITLGIFATIAIFLGIFALAGIFSFGIQTKRRRDAFFAENEAEYKARKDDKEAEKLAAKLAKQAPIAPVIDNQAAAIA